MAKGTSFDNTAPPQGMLPLSTTSLIFSTLKLFFLFASLAMRTSFRYVDPPIIGHCCYFDELVFCDKDTAGTNCLLISILIIRYIAPLTHSLYTSYHWLIVLKMVLGFSQDFHHFCFDQWCNLLTLFSIL